jgi:hypothetical protein
MIAAAIVYAACVLAWFVVVELVSCELPDLLMPAWMRPSSRAAVALGALLGGVLNCCPAAVSVPMTAKTLRVLAMSPSERIEGLESRLTGGEQLLRFASPAVGGFDVGSRSRGLEILGARLATSCLLGCCAQVCGRQSQPDFTR